MATKDLRTVPNSIFVAALTVIILVGVGLALVLANADPMSTESTEPSRANELAEETAGSDRVTGVVTEVFRDCASRQVLIDGEAVEQGPISCDGGSYITIDNGDTIYFASGFVPQDMAFSYDIGELAPGNTAEVVFQTNEFGGFDLNCDACSVQILE